MFDFAGQGGTGVASGATTATPEASYPGIQGIRENDRRDTWIGPDGGKEPGITPERWRCRATDQKPQGPRPGRRKARRIAESIPPTGQARGPGGR